MNEVICPTCNYQTTQDHLEEHIKVNHPQPEPITNEEIKEAAHPTEEVKTEPTEAVKVEVVQVDIVSPENDIQKQEENRDEKGKFLPGVSGNPNGRPKREWTWQSLIEEYAEKKRTITNKKTGESKEYRYREIIIKRLYDEAANGNIHAAREIMNRTDGMPNQLIGNTPGKNGQPSTFNVRNTNFSNAVPEEIATAAITDGARGDTNTA